MKSLANGRGFTLVESMIAVAIAMIAVVGIFSGIDSFTNQRTRSSRSLATRVLLAQVVSTVSSHPEQYPPFSVGGADDPASYVLCFNGQLAQVDFSPTEFIGLVTSASLATDPPTRQCTTIYEGRVSPVTDAAGRTRWTIDIVSLDPSSGSVVKKVSASFANAVGI